MLESAPVLTGGLLRPNIRLSPNGKRLYTIGQILWLNLNYFNYFRERES